MRSFVEDKSAHAVIVAGVGPHLNALGDYKKAFDWLARYLAKHKRLFGRGGRLRMLWKTAEAPWVGCHEHTKPVSPAAWRNRPHSGAYDFWNNVEEYDNLAVERLGRSGLVSTILDMTPVYRRPDAKAARDCLHTCGSDPEKGSAVVLFAYKLYDALRCPHMTLV